MQSPFSFKHEKSISREPSEIDSLFIEFYEKRNEIRKDKIRGPKGYTWSIFWQI